MNKGNKKYTIRVCYDVKGWAYHRRAVALQKYAPMDFDVTIGPDYGAALKQTQHDLVLQLCYSYAQDLRRHIDANAYDIVLVSGFNVGLGYADQWFAECAKWSDHVIINNRECWQGLGQPTDTTWISNGVDRRAFPLITPPKNRDAKVIWTGSQCHRSTKRYDELLLPLAEQLRKHGIPTDFHIAHSMGGKDRRSQTEMAQWYNTGTIYVVASRTEGTPNPALEAASAGCVVVSTRVGNMPELIDSGVNGELADGTVGALLAAVMRCNARYPEMATAMQREIDAWDWRERAAEYFDLFRELIDARRCKRSRIRQKLAGSHIPNVRSLPTTAIEDYWIVTYFSRDYLDAFEFSIGSWLRTNARRVIAYTDFSFSHPDPRVEVRQLFTPSDDWLSHVGRKIEAARHCLANDPPQRLAFLDVDCYVRDDFGEVFRGLRGLAVTRLFSSEAYAHGTATCGVWFARVSDRLITFFDQWQQLATETRSAGKGVRPGMIAYDQFAFTDLVKQNYHNGPLAIRPLDERIYNCEHTDRLKWQRFASDCNPKIIHFKGRRYRDAGLVRDILDCAEPKKPDRQPPRKTISADRLKRFGSHLPLTQSLLEHSPHDLIVECGMGKCSTPLFLRQAGRGLISIEHDPMWYALVLRGLPAASVLFPRLVRLGCHIDATTRCHTASNEQIAELDRVYEQVASELRPWGTIDLLFVDTLSAARLSALAKLHTLARVIVVHDTEPANFHGYGYDRFAAEFGHKFHRYCYSLSGDWPWTDVFARERLDGERIVTSLERHSRAYFGSDTGFEFVASLED